MDDRQQEEDAFARKDRLDEGAEPAIGVRAQGDGDEAPPRTAPRRARAAADANASVDGAGQPEETGGAPGDAAAHAPADALPSDGPALFIPRITVGAFVEDAGVRKALSGAAADRRMMRATLDIAEGDIRTAVQRYREAPAPELIIVEIRLGHTDLFRTLEELAEQCPPGTRLLLIGHENDVRLYRQLLKFGVGDYLVAPLGPMAAIEAVAQLFHETAEEHLGKVVAFLGARGGAGSSTVALNVGIAIGRHCQASALLLDLDLHFGTAAFDLNLEPAQGVRDALDEGERLDATLLDRLTTTYGERLGVLASSCKLGDPPHYEPEAFGRLIETARKSTPHLLLDLPHGWNPAVRTALMAADEIILTATPDLSALRNARNIASSLRAERPNDPPPRLVLNGLGLPKRKELSPDDFKRILELEPTVEIAHDPAAFSAASASGEPVVLRAGTAEPFNALARILTGQKEATGGRRGGGWMRRLMKRTA